MIMMKKLFQMKLNRLIKLKVVFKKKNIFKKFLMTKMKR